jgi:Mor family transcriptional regulator
MVHALVALDEDRQPIPEDVCGNPDEVKDLCNHLQVWLQGRIPPREAQVVAESLSDRIRRMWGGIQTVVNYPGSGGVPRFISEVEAWARGILAEEVSLEGDELEGLVLHLKSAIWNHYSGTVIYFRKTDPGRNQKILHDWEKNMNIIDLARKWNLTTPHLYEILNRELHRRSRSA